MTTKERPQGFTYLNGPFSRDGIYPWQTYYGKHVKVDRAEPSYESYESRVILYRSNRSDEKLLRLDINLFPPGLPGGQLVFKFFLDQTPRFPNLVYGGQSYNFPMSGVFGITTDGKEELRFPYPLTEDEMGRIPLNIFSPSENGRLRLQYNMATPPIQIYFEFPKPCGEWPKDALSGILPQMLPREVMAFIQDLGFNVIFS